jgi:hypothetical protein
VAAAAEIPRAERWQPIETAPRDGTRVLLYFESRWTLGGTFNDLSNDWLIDGDHEEPPTHWMPLPPAPEVP